jgi:hypothetical protein
MQVEEGRKTRRAAVNARKAMAPDDTGASSHSSEDSGSSADVRMSGSDEEGTESGEGVEVWNSPSCSSAVMHSSVEAALALFVAIRSCSDWRAGVRPAGC